MCLDSLCILLPIIPIMSLTIILWRKNKKTFGALLIICYLCTRYLTC